MKTIEREFNIFEGKRPRVLLLGNGLNRAYNGKSWDQLLDSIKEAEEFPLNAEKYIMPMPLKAAMLTNNKLASKMREIVKNANPSDNGHKEQKITWQDFTMTNPEMRRQIRRIVKHFDYVLTTNYSYEIEMALLETENLSAKQIAKYMSFHEIDNAQTKFLINTYNCVKDTPIWHIHGEARKPDSMIIGSAFYGKLLKRCIERIDGTVTSKSNEQGKTERKQVGKEQEYRRNYRNKQSQKIGSWIDAFVLGDVYILGLGLDFSESDLWWLIDYKSQNKDLFGHTYFYDPKKEAKQVCVADRNIPCERTSFFADGRQCRDFLLEKTYEVHLDDFGVICNSTENYRLFYELVANEFDQRFII